LQEKS
jgi:hypothetical protein